MESLSFLSINDHFPQRCKGSLQHASRRTEIDFPGERIAQLLHLSKQLITESSAFSKKPNKERQPH